MLVQENIFRYTVIKKKKKLVRKVINKKALIINWHTMFKRLPTTVLYVCDEIPFQKYPDYK